jgi:SAM-dependent methyltransferase
MSSNNNSTVLESNQTTTTALSPEKLQEALYGFELSQVIYVTAKLGLADCLRDGAKSGAELATQMGANAKVLDHFLPLLLNLGLVTTDENQHYQLTPTGSLLRSDHPHSILGMALSTADIYQAWGNFWYSVQTGQAAFDNVFQMSLYEYLAQHAEANTHFNRWMEETTRAWLLPALVHYDFSPFTSLVDIGGSTGVLTSTILTQYPQLQAIIFDQPHVVNDATEILTAAGVRHRVQLCGGDFFVSIPSQGDLYIISRVLLNWEDEPALKILQNCRAAMSPLAKLLIMDFLLPNQNPTALDFLSSLHLLVLGGRLLRTADEYSALLSAAGFHSPQLIKTEGFISFIEALPSP